MRDACLLQNGCGGASDVTGGAELAFQVSSPLFTALKYCLVRLAISPQHTPLLHKSKVFQMPNISFDIFFNDDVLNFTASRSQGAPKVKPAWKVRSAPKLPPKEPPKPATSVFAAPKARITELPEPATTKKTPKAITAPSVADSGTSEASLPRRPQKLPTKAAADAKKTAKPNNAAKKAASKAN
ncbi:hypothetical protein MMC20_008090 [Loxospora ochrophaea]|nr:hypothetical protein [Loxospora ochrophaea]